MCKTDPGLQHSVVDVWEVLMIMVAPIAIAGATALASGIAGWFGKRSSNKANRQEAQKNRRFQERMRNTEWQAGVADMEKAGINPALAYSQGGASAPSGAVAASQESSIGEGVSSALAVKTAQEQYALLREQKGLISAQKRKTQFESVSASRVAERDTAKWSYYFDANGRAKPPLMELLRQEHGASMANGARSVTELNLARLKEPEMRALAKLFESVGGGGKGMQIAMPLLMQLLRKGS